MKTELSNLFALLLAKKDLSAPQMYYLTQSIMRGEVDSSMLAGLLVALRMKGESLDEITAAAQVMRELATPVPIAQDDSLVDTCGTGGDGAHTFNISTTAAFVAAAAGVKIAKHGGRSVSSSAGSADVLETLGANLQLTAEQVAYCVDTIGIGFMFAPNHHHAMRHAAPVRKALGIRTIFNLLGPLSNPAGAKRQVLGVFDRQLVPLLARVLQKLGSERVMVVHGMDGLDEITLSGATYVAELIDGHIREYTLYPRDFALQEAPLSELMVHNTVEAAAVLMAVLNNQAGAARDIVALNAGAAIYIAGLTESHHAGVELAFAVLTDGRAAAKLHDFIALTQHFSPFGNQSA